MSVNEKEFTATFEQITDNLAIVTLKYKRYDHVEKEVWRRIER